MARRSSRTHSPAFKAKAALAALKGEKTRADVASDGTTSLRRLWTDLRTGFRKA